MRSTSAFETRLQNWKLHDDWLFKLSFFKSFNLPSASSSSVPRYVNLSSD